MDKPEIKKRGKKRDKVVEKVAEAKLAVISNDILSLDEMNNFPDLRKENERNQMIIMATACGMSQPFIAKALGVSQPTINEIINRIDPNKQFRLSPDSKKAFMTQMYGTRCVEALMSITPEKLEESSAVELSRIAKTMNDAAQNLNMSKHKNISSNKMDMLMDALESEAVDADFEEVK